MKIRVVAIIVDTTRLTLYKEDGNTVEIEQGDPRVRRIVDEALPVVEQGLVAEIELEQSSNSYRDFEEKTGGFARFFRVAKSKLASLFTDTSGDDVVEPVPPVRAGNIPGQAAQAAYAKVTDEETGAAEKPVPAVKAPPTRSEKAKAVEEIISSAEPAASDSFRDEDHKDTHTMVAVVKDKTTGTKKLIPGVEQLRGQLRNTTAMNSTVGLEAFLARIAKVIDERQHSVEDLLRFMDRGDLPVAEDGSIIAYKLLKRQDDGYYVDCHTSRVRQRVGSYVCVAEDLVDRNRRNECSNGLHVARRAYLKSFGGDVCVLVKVAPEDVVTVPHGDPNKVRVCGYHILFELDAASFRKVKSNQPMTDNETAQLMLGKAITGDHTRVIEEVRITQQQGCGVVITPMPKNQGPVLEGDKKRELKVTAFEAPADPGKQTLDAPPVDPKTVTQKSKQPQPAAKPASSPATGPKAPSSRQTKVRQLFSTLQGEKDAAKRHALAVEITKIKKTSKVSWGILGLDDRQVTYLTQVVDNPPVKVEAKPTIDPLVEGATALEAAGKALAVPEPKKTISGAPDAPPAGKFDRKAEAKRLFEIADNHLADPKDRRAALADLSKLKSKSRVSWAALGLVSNFVVSLDSRIASAAKKAAEAPKASAPASTKPSSKAKTKAQPKAEVKSPSKTKVSGEKPKPVSTKTYPDSHAGRARQLFDERKFGPLFDYKQRAKKSWKVLGFTEGEEKTILANKPK